MVQKEESEKGWIEYVYCSLSLSVKRYVTKLEIVGKARSKGECDNIYYDDGI